MKNRLFTSLTTTLFAIIALQAQAQTTSPASSETPFGEGEVLLYNVTYRAALIPPINIMGVSIRTVAENLGGKRHFHIIGNGRTTGAAKGIFELNDTYHSWLDAESILPSRASSDVHEDNYRFRATYNYDWNSMTVSNVRRNVKWTEDSVADTFPTVDEIKTGSNWERVYEPKKIRIVKHIFKIT